MARCTAPVYGHRSAAAAANCPACGSRYGRYGGYSSYGYSSPSYSPSGSSGGRRSSSGASGRRARPRWAPAGSPGRTRCILVFATFCILALNPALLLGQPKEWRVSPKPAVRIGLDEGESEYLLSRVVGAVRLGDGRIAVASRSSNDIRFYDASGSYLSKAGRSGSGPGEFRSLSRLLRSPNDTLLALDLIENRLDVFDSTPKHIRTVRLKTALFHGRTGPDTYILSTAQAAPVRGPFMITKVLLRYNSRTQDLDTIATIPNQRMHGLQQPGTNRVGTEQPPYEWNVEVAVGPGQIVYGSSNSRTVIVTDGSGKRVNTVTIRGSGRNVTATDLGEWERWYVETAGDRFGTPSPMQERPRLRQAFSEMTAAPRTPEYSGLFLDTQGNLWVRHYAPLWRPTYQWDVYSLRGAFLAKVELPSIEPFEIGSDYVLGLSTDKLGVERIEMYRLLK